jgi:hypothetical protein
LRHIARVGATALAAGLAFAAGGSRAEGEAGVLLKGEDGRVVTLSAADIAAAPRAVVRLTHNGNTVTYEGARLDALLTRVGAPLGKALRGPAMADVVLIKASDGYRVALALAEADPGVRSDPIILADREDGGPMGTDGPFRIVVGGDLRPARSARSVVEIDVIRLP